MNPESLFSLSSSFAALGWVYLMAAARWTPKAFSAIRIAIPVTLSVGYALSFALASPDLQGSFGSIEAVRLLFQNDWALAAGWIHYLAFDFFVGCWILDNATSRGIHHVFVVPILIATFMLGPIGFLLYRGIEISGLSKRAKQP